MADSFHNQPGLSGRPQSVPVPDSSTGGNFSLPDNHARLEHGLDSSLKLIAEQAQTMTRASGAAIALREGELMVCRARAGVTAPDIGAPLDTRSGLSGECVRTGRTLVCKDTESDDRVNLDVCRYLGIRSIVVMPIHLGQELVGVFEVFSPEAEAFGLSELAALESMRELVLSVVRPTPAEPRPTPAPAAATRKTSAQHAFSPAQSTRSSAPPLEKVDLSATIFGTPDPEDDLMCEIEAQPQVHSRWQDAPSGELLDDQTGTLLGQEEELTTFAPADDNRNIREHVISRKLLLAGVITVVFGLMWLAWCNHSIQSAVRRATSPKVNTAAASVPSEQSAPVQSLAQPAPREANTAPSIQAQQATPELAQKVPRQALEKPQPSPKIVRSREPIIVAKQPARLPQPVKQPATTNGPDILKHSSVPPQTAPAPTPVSASSTASPNPPQANPAASSNTPSISVIGTSRVSAAPISAPPPKPIDNNIQQPVSAPSQPSGNRLSIAQATVTSLDARLTGLTSSPDAMQLLLNSATAGDAHAQLALAVRYANGDGVHRSYPEAWKWFTRAESQGVTPSDSKSAEAKRKVEQWIKKTQPKQSFQ